MDNCYPTARNWMRMHMLTHSLKHDNTEKNIVTVTNGCSLHKQLHIVYLCFWSLSAFKAFAAFNPYWCMHAPAPSKQRILSKNCYATVSTNRHLLPTALIIQAKEKQWDGPFTGLCYYLNYRLTSLFFPISCSIIDSWIGLYTSLLKHCTIDK